MNKKHDFWEKIFAAKKFDPKENLHFITADEIKAITGAEPRILGKIDTSRDLPPVFKKHGYFLLPVKNGEYAIVRGEGFHRLEAMTPAIQHVSRLQFPLATAGRGSSEMQYLDYSFNSGALEGVLGKQPLYQSIRGREYTKEFSFFVNDVELDVSSVQIEVDSGLEGEDSIVLIEAKVGTPEDFIIRQLFYPYNHFKALVPGKTIIPVLFAYEPKTKIYNFWIYEIPEENNYNSIRLSRMQSLTIVTKDALAVEDLRPLGRVAYKDLIPQANDINKIIELVFKVSEGINNYRDVAAHFQFRPRQSDYYREAAEALGLLISSAGVYRLTDMGREFVQLPAEKRNIYFSELLSEFSLMRESLDLLQRRHVLRRADIEEIIRARAKITGTTISRRAQSLMAWLRWMAEATGAFAVEADAFRLNP